MWLSDAVPQLAMDRKRKLESNSVEVAEPGKLARSDGSLDPAQRQVADSMRKRKVESNGTSAVMPSPTSATVVKRARFADDVGASSAAGSQPPLSGTGASKVPEDFVTTLAKQLEKIALYGNAFFTNLAFRHHAAASAAAAGAAGVEEGSRHLERGRPALRPDDYFDSLQATRCQLFSLVEEMLLRAHEIEELSPVGGGEEMEEVVPALPLVPAPARAADRSEWLALGLAESNAELSRRMKEVADTSGLVDDVIRHLYNE